MTTAPVPAELEELLGSLEAMAAMQRDPNIPEGAVIGAGDIAGAPTTWRKQSSMVNFGGKPMPERLPYYNQIDGQLCYLPTANLPQLLLERVDGVAVFSRTRPASYVEPVAIAETCEVCLKRRKGVPRPFYDESDLDAHYQNLHPRELATKRRREDREEKQADALRQTRLADAILAAVELRNAPAKKE